MPVQSMLMTLAMPSSSSSGSSSKIYPSGSSILLAVATGGVLLHHIYKHWWKQPTGMPGMTTCHWLLGDLPRALLAISRLEQLELFHETHKELGSTFKIYIPFTRWRVVTSCPANVEYILKTHFKNFPKGAPFHAAVEDLLGNGIFAADGDIWHMQRKVASRMFTTNLFKEHIWIVVERNAKKLRNKLEASDPSKVVDLFNFMNRFTLDTIGEVGFGKTIGALEDPSSPFLRSFDAAQRIVFLRFFLPGWRLLRFFGIGSETTTKEHMDRLDSYSREVVRELGVSLNRSTSDKSSSIAWADIEGRKSFLGLFMQDAKQGGHALSEDFCRDLVLNFLIAGRDTTAQALSWTIFCLCTHPEIQERAREEVEQVCGIRGPCYDDLPHLQFLNACISEALRLYPSVPIDVKTVAHDDTLPDGSWVPAGTEVAYDIYSMGRDPKIWGPDAEVFRPDRWLEAETAPDNYHYPVFNGGPRECLGRRLAMVEMKACLAMLLPQFKLELAVDAEDVTQDAQLTIGMAKGLPCYVTRRHDSADCPSSRVSTAPPSEIAGDESD